jgi:hypothetical protein
MNNNKIENIDAVYTWVDNSDKKWLEKFKKCTGQNPPANRYKDYGELEFSIKLLLKYCNFIRKIFIVTDNQIPKWYNNNDYPNIYIIDHSEILGEECCKPTFKSDSIEAYLHKIPDLSEFYLYLNDDFFIGNYCNIYNFIDRKTNLPIARMKNTILNHTLKLNLLRGMTTFARGISLYNSVECIKKKYNKHFNLSPIHQCVILRKSMGELAWKLFPNELKKSVQYPLRIPKKDTIAFINLSLLLGIVNNNMVLEIDRYSIKIYENYSLSKGGVNYNLTRILRLRPQLFCINDINDNNYLLFNKFKNKYLNITP